MNALQSAIFAASIFLITTGIFCLIAAWSAPQVLDNRFMRWLITGERLAPTRANRTLAACWAILLGGFFLLSVTGHHTLSYIAFAAWLPLAIALLRRRFTTAAEA